MSANFTTRARRRQLSGPKTVEGGCQAPLYISQHAERPPELGVDFEVPAEFGDMPGGPDVVLCDGDPAVRVDDHR